MIVLILAVWFIARGGEKPDPDAFLFGRDGWTMEECKASGEAKVAKALTGEDVLGASFKCVEMPMREGV